jgi:propionyl-CoA synthetase
MRRPHPAGDGSVIVLKKCIVVDRLPKTRSGKILRETMVSIVNGTP